MRSPTAWTRATLILLAALTAALTVACSSGNKNANGPDAAATPTTTVTIVATDNKFDLKRIVVPAGQEVTLTVQNKGEALHNFHVFGVKTDDGQEIQTSLTEKLVTTKFTLSQKGTYDYRCDVHPEMNGKLTVQ